MHVFVLIPREGYMELDMPEGATVGELRDAVLQKRPDLTRKLIRWGSTQWATGPDSMRLTATRHSVFTID